MKLTDLIDALAAEIRLAEDQLEESLRELATRDADDPSFLDAWDRYSGQAQRMGEAAELAGFPGLQAVCSHVVENCLLLTVTPPDERGPLIAFLRGWPPLIVFYLGNLGDPSAAVGVVDHLCTAPSPMEPEQAKKVMHMLGAMPQQVLQPGGNDAPPRPVLATPEDVSLAMPDDVDARLLEGFQQEAPEQGRQLVAFATRLAAGQAGTAELVAAKRVVHTLKGSGSIIGLRGIANLSHHLEDLLEHFEEDDAGVSQGAADTVRDAAWCLEQMVNHVLGADEAPQQSLGVLQAVLDLANLADRGLAPLASPRVARAEVPTPATDEGPAVATSEASPAAETSNAAPAAALRVSVQRIDDLFRVSGEVSVQASAMEAGLKALVESSRALLAQNLRVQKRLFELETLVDVRTAGALRGRARAGLPQAGFDPLEMDQYNELHGTSHALVEEAADARALAARVEEEIAQLSGLQARQQRLHKDLQHLVIGTRMSEVGGLESRLQRNVRSTASATGKDVTLALEGGGTLIDSDLLQRLAEPLLHLLRNAVDHGIETPDERLAAGKAAQGRIVLRFARQGQQVVLRCDDDGRGMDAAAIRARAEARGLVGADRVLTEEETLRLVLLPGFSTRDVVTETSGRGVGLDVVREWIRQVNGSLRIVSRPGQGCSFELRFAASLTTVQSLVVEATGQRFALPSVHVEQAVPRGVGRFEAVGERWIFRHGDRALAAQHLGDLAGLPAAPSRSLDDCDAVIVRVDDRAWVLAVDRLLDARELLVKSPGRYLRHARGVAGLSVLGDGRVAVNLDVAQMLDEEGRAMQGGAQRAAVAAGMPTAREGATVLIVDDSLSVRNTLRQLVEDAGWRAETARDGLEAVAALRTWRPSLVLTDLEMPQMNGVELTQHIRARADLARVPVVMITSRSQDKHRRAAEQAGVTQYFTKPYNDGELLQAIRRHLEA